VRYARDTLGIEFATGVGDAAISDFLRRLRLKPVGMIGMFNRFTAVTVEPQDLAGLFAREQEAQQDARVERAYMPCTVLPMEDAAAERLPLARLETAGARGEGAEQRVGSFGADEELDLDEVGVERQGQVTFSSLRLGWPAWVMQLPEAHRLLDQVLVDAATSPPGSPESPQFPQIASVTLSLIDTGFSPSRHLTAERILAVTLANGEDFAGSPQREFRVVTRALEGPTRAETLEAIRDRAQTGAGGARIRGHGTPVAHFALADGPVSGPGEIEPGTPVVGIGCGVRQVRKGRLVFSSPPRRGLAFQPCRLTAGAQATGELILNEETSDRVIAATVEMAVDEQTDPAQLPASRPMEVLNVSYGGYNPQVGSDAGRRRDFEEAFDLLANYGKAVVIAAGNQGANVADTWPARLAPSGTRNLGTIQFRIRRGQSEFGNQGQRNNGDSPLTLAVASMAIGAKIEDLDGPERLAEQSNHGERISVSAPGGNVVSIGSDGEFYRTSGTSHAAPMVSGLLAQMMQLERTLHPPPAFPTPEARNQYLRANTAYLVEVLEYTADNLRFAPRDQGHGRINAWRALLAVANGGVATLAPADRFGHLTLAANRVKDDSRTTWYGFEIRTKVRDAEVLLTPNPLEDGVPIVDDGNPWSPTTGGRVTAYRGVVRQLDGAEFASGVTGRIPVGVPVEANGRARDFARGSVRFQAEFLATFTIKRSELVGKGLALRDPASGRVYYRLPMHMVLVDTENNLRRTREREVQSRGVSFDHFVFSIDETAATNKGE
jgi:hypothetical protein